MKIDIKSEPPKSQGFQHTEKHCWYIQSLISKLMLMRDGLRWLIPHYSAKTFKVFINKLFKYKCQKQERT